MLAELREQRRRAGAGDPRRAARAGRQRRPASAASPTTSPPSRRRSGPGCRSSLQAGLFVGLTLFGLAALNPWLALAALPAVPIQLLGLRHYLKHVVPLYSHQRVQEGERTQRLIGAITGAKTSRALGLGALRRDEVATTSLTAADTALRAARLQSDRFGRAMNGGELVGPGERADHRLPARPRRQRHGRRGDRRGAVLPPRVRPRGHALRARRRLPGGGVRAHAPDGRDHARSRAARSTRTGDTRAVTARRHPPRLRRRAPGAARDRPAHRARRARRADRHHRRGQDDDRAHRRGPRGARRRARSRSAATSGSSRRRSTSSRARSPPTCGWPSPTRPTSELKRRPRPGRRELGPRAARDRRSARAATRSPPPRRSRSRSPASPCTTRRSRSSTRPEPKPAAPARARWRAPPAASSTAAPRWSSRTGSRRPDRGPDRRARARPDRRAGHARRSCSPNQGRYAQLWEAWRG